MDDKAVGAVARAIYECSMQREHAKNLPLPSWDSMTAEQRESWLDEGRAAIEAYEAALREAGMVIVPREPTEVMADKGEYVGSEWLNDNAPLGQAMYREPAKAIWRAMITAAPDTPDAEQSVISDDWDSLYSFTRDRLPDAYRALVNIDVEITRIVRAGGKWSNDDRLRELGDNHSKIIAALRVIVPRAGAPDQRG